MIILVLSRAGGSRLLDLTSGAVWLGGLACGFVMAFLYVHVYRDLWPPLAPLTLTSHSGVFGMLFFWRCVETRFVG